MQQLGLKISRQLLVAMSKRPSRCLLSLDDVPIATLKAQIRFFGEVKSKGAKPDVQKTKSFKKKKDDRDDTKDQIKESESKKTDDFILNFLNKADAARRISHSYTDEEEAERERIKKEYAVQTAHLYRQMEKDLATKIHLSQEAMTALPPILRKKATHYDPNPPPRHRPWPKWETPPIKGFSYRSAEVADYDSTQLVDEQADNSAGPLGSIDDYNFGQVTDDDDDDDEDNR